MQCAPPPRITNPHLFPAAVSSSNQTYLQELKDKELGMKEEVDSIRIRLEAFSVRTCLTSSAFPSIVTCERTKK